MRLTIQFPDSLTKYIFFAGLLPANIFLWARSNVMKSVLSMEIILYKDIQARSQTNKLVKWLSEVTVERVAFTAFSKEWFICKVFKIIFLF